MRVDRGSALSLGWRSAHQSVLGDLALLFQCATTPTGTGFAALTNALASPRAKELFQAQQTLPGSALDAVVRRWLLIVVVHLLLHFACLESFWKTTITVLGQNLCNGPPIPWAQADVVPL